MTQEGKRRRKPPKRKPRKPWKPVEGGAAKQRQERVLEHIRAGLTVDEATARAGVTPAAYEKWQSRDPEFRAELARVRERTTLNNPHRGYGPPWPDHSDAKTDEEIERDAVRLIKAVMHLDRHTITELVTSYCFDSYEAGRMILCLAGFMGYFKEFDDRLGDFEEAVDETLEALRAT